MQRIDTNNDIAVIGMSGRFPGAATLADFYRNLRNGIYSVTEVPPSRWNAQDFYSTQNDIINKTSSKWGGYLSDIYQFDPLFFRIAPKEAQVMDPQQRLFLEVAWEVLEDAGYSNKQLDNTKCGVFVLPLVIFLKKWKGIIFL
jgi:acyl transferase domain-containing protein